MIAEKIKCYADNVLVLMDAHRPGGDERVSRGGIVLPATRERRTNEALPATVVSAGHGHWRDKWLGPNEGTAPDGSRIFVHMDPALRRGVRVLVEGPNQGDKVWDHEGTQYRMLREHNILAIVEDG